MQIEVDGYSTFVGTGGVDWQPGRATLLLQHGAGMDRTIWVLLARYGARHGYNIVAADLPGHGASKGKPLDSIESQGLWLHALLDELEEKHGLPEAELTLGGHSMGALAVMAAAAHKPDAVQALLLFGVGYPMHVGPPLLEAAKKNEQAAIDMITFFGHSYSSRLGHNPVAGISVYNAADALLGRAEPGVLFTDLQACNDYRISDASLATLASSMRCSIISGVEDRMTPAKYSGALADSLNAIVHRLDDCGHMMMAEQPEACLQAMLKALQSG